MPDLRLETVFDALAAQKRRAVCRYVAATDRDVMAIDELTGRVEPDARDGDSRSATTADHEVRARLHHVDLPKLADADVIDYDPERREVTAGPALSMAVDLVRAVDGDSGGRS